MTPDEKTVERVAKAMAFDRRSPLDASEDDNDFWAHAGEQAKDGCRGTARAAIAAMPETTQSSSGDDGNRESLMWAVEKWRDEVQNRPLHNVLRRTLDDTWRTVMRKFGGDPDELVGPSHDDLVATAAEGDQ